MPEITSSSSRMSRMTINECVDMIHKIAVDHGWWEEERPFAEVAMLCTCELAEAVEEDRAGHPLVWRECGKSGRPCSEECMDFRYPDQCEEDWIKCKPEGIAVEMLDCVIRIFDWCGKMGIDAEKIIKEKCEFNATRPYKHGKKY